MSEADNELPGMLALSLAIQEQRWPQSMDARVWAQKWMEHIKENPSIATDEDCMIGWFANAIMAGYDTAQMGGSR